MFYPPRRSKDGCTIVSDNEECCLTQTGAQVVLRVPTRNELFVFNFEEVFFFVFLLEGYKLLLFQKSPVVDFVIMKSPFK